MIDINNINFTDKIQTLVSLIRNTGLFSSVTVDNSNNISCYTGDKVVLYIEKQSANVAKITYTSDNASGTIGGNSGFDITEIDRIVTTSKGFVLGNNEVWNLFFGKTIKVSDNSEGIGCIYCSPLEVSNDSYKSVGKTSTAIDTHIPIPANTSNITVLTNAYTPSGFEYFPDIYISTAVENTSAGRISINGKTGYTNGRVTLMD